MFALGHRELREYCCQIVLVLTAHVLRETAVSVRRLILHGVRKREQFVQRAESTRRL